MLCSLSSGISLKPTTTSSAAETTLATMVPYVMHTPATGGVRNPTMTTSTSNVVFGLAAVLALLIFVTLILIIGMTSISVFILKTNKARNRV